MTIIGSYVSLAQVVHQQKYLAQCLSSSKGITLLIMGKGRLLKKGIGVWKGRGWAKPTQHFIVLIANAYSFVLQLWLFFPHLPSIFLFFHLVPSSHPPTRPPGTKLKQWNFSTTIIIFIIHVPSSVLDNAPRDRQRKLTKNLGNLNFC